MPINKPNFFIIGAPKCGTTSIYSWLDGNPQVCMSKPKEPRFFNPRLKSEIKTIGEYEACFSHATPSHRAVGEVCTQTLYSNKALKNILEYQPQAKFIVCLRNPIEMAVSFHNHLVFDSDQGISDFLAAWNSSAIITRWDWHEAYTSHDMYRDFCALGTHYRNFLGNVPKERVLTLVLDDMIADPFKELSRVAEYLEIDIGKTTYQRKNKAKRVRSKNLKRVTDSISIVKKALGIRASLGLGTWLAGTNLRKDSGAATLTLEIHDVLAEYFKPEIVLLESRLSRDLSHWLTPKPTLREQ